MSTSSRVERPPRLEIGGVGEELAIFLEDGKESGVEGFDLLADRRALGRLEGDLEGRLSQTGRSPQDTFIAGGKNSPARVKSVDLRIVITRQEFLGRAQGRLEQALGKNVTSLTAAEKAVQAVAGIIAMQRDD